MQKYKDVERRDNESKWLRGLVMKVYIHREENFRLLYIYYLTCLEYFGMLQCVIQGPIYTRKAKN